jgi:hypothetical protein
VKESHENNGNHGGGVFTSRRKMALEPTMASKHLPRRTKTEADWKKDLQIYEAGRKSRKNPRRSWA